MARQDKTFTAPLPFVRREGDAPSIKLDRNSYVPFYRQIADQVREQVQSGWLIPGKHFWSEGEIAQKLGVSKMTIRQAFQTLRADGLLIIEKGKRPLVGTGRIQKNFQELRGFTEEMSQRGLRASSKLLSAESIVADPDTAKVLCLKGAERVYRIKRLRFANDEIVGLEISHLPAHLFPGLEDLDLARRSLYSLIEALYDVKLGWSQEEMEAVAAKKEEAKLLRVPRGFPLFSVRRRVYSSEGVPIEYALSLFHGGRYSATVTSRRKF
jgi:GntR family transcriptional regulator